ncbi:JAB domain-containing protein [Castellaniella ginsengisoli]|uniref:JAB domain-containing protein n=1 Tax=Castellaniella ginsengisoli TaxID=546114 RepID=A0AB39GBD1_9BURK
MSQLSLSSFDASLIVRDAHGRYLLATTDQILEAARQAIENKMQRGASFSSPEAVKEYLRAKLAGFEHEVFAVLFLDTQHRLIEYAEMFRGTIDSASVYPRELVKEALRLNAAAAIISHNHPSGNLEPSAADLNRPGNRGGCLVKVKPPQQRVLQAPDSTVVRPRREGCRQSIPAAADD